jgi:ESCRT-I complex subunit VPS28
VQLSKLVDTLSSRIVMNLDEEVRPYTTSAEREKTENLATLYSIIVSLEYLERAYVRDSVTGKEYVLS